MEKKLNLQGFSNLLAFYVLAVTSIACQPKGRAKNNSSPINPLTEASQAPSKKKNGFSHIVEGDSILQRIHLNDKLQYESLIVEEKRVYNNIYPNINDSFLFEDKYYLKISYSIPFSGTIETTIPECPDYVLTPLDNGILQVVIYNALDLSAVDLKFNYFPSEKDSLVSSEYFFNHVIFN
ncbi:hypothetical protein GCM10027284_28400 [Cyclobacterium sediminis]